MWNVWKEELYKIASHKIVWLGIFFLLLFTGWRLGAESRHYSATIGAKTYYGREAIEKDKELAAEYAGILTIEKVHRIYDAYGFYYYDTQKDTYIGNFCNRFITEEMTNFHETGGEDPDEIAFYEGGDWEFNVSPLLKGDVWFDYVHGWKDLREMYAFMVTALFLLFIIGVSPVFAEEYTLKTAGLLLTTKRGKGGGIWMKITAALFFMTVVYIVCVMFLWEIYWYVYGEQGLDASAALLGISTYGYCPAKVGGFFVFEFVLGLAGIFLLCGITLGVSAFSKNAFLSVIVSVLLFFVPYTWMNVFAFMLVPLLGNVRITPISHFMVSMPFYLPLNWGFGFTGRQIVLHLSIAAAVGILGAVLGYRRFRGYEG